MPAYSVQPPEPALTPVEMVQRAERLLPVLRERQSACEAAGRLPEETNRDFLNAGFYRIIQPRRFGGYEFDLPTFVKVMMAISRGCMESGWVLALTAGHPIFLVKFSEEGQREGFGPTGDFRAPGVATPAGCAIPAEGGYRVKGFWDYASGCDVATHFLGATFVRESEDGPPQGVIYVLIDRKDFTIVDNWHVMGMRGTGSRRVVVDEMFVPTHRTIHFADAAGQRPHKYPGDTLHANPFYRGRILPLLLAELAAVAVGGAKGALDVYEEVMRVKKVALPPFLTRSQYGEYLRHFGQAQAWIEIAEAALLKTAADYMEMTRREVVDGISVTDEEERKLQLVESHCVRMAWDAVDLMFRTAGTSSAAGEGAPLGRYFRNLAVIRTHIAMQLDHTAENVGRLHFGLPVLSHV